MKADIREYLKMKPAAASYTAMLVLLILCSGCQSPAPSRPGPDTVAAPETRVDAGHFLRCYDLDSRASELRLLVFRTGPLARVGHNHVMVSHSLTGTLARGEPFNHSRAQVTLPVASLEIDPVALRSEEGADFASDVSDEARAGTRTNMLGTGVLDAEAFPEVTLELLSLSGPQWSADAVVRIRLKDQLREKTVPVSLLEAAGGIRAISSFTVSQTDFGMTPFSVLGGGLRVSDEVTIRVNLLFIPSAADNSSCIVNMDQEGDRP